MRKCRVDDDFDYIQKMASLLGGPQLFGLAGLQVAEHGQEIRRMKLKELIMSVGYRVIWRCLAKEGNQVFGEAASLSAGREKDFDTGCKRCRLTKAEGNIWSLRESRHSAKGERAPQAKRGRFNTTAILTLFQLGESTQSSSSIFQKSQIRVLGARSRNSLCAVRIGVRES